MKYSGSLYLVLLLSVAGCSGTQEPERPKLLPLPKLPIPTDPLPEQAPVPPYTVASIRAHLFYNGSATFSENIIDNQDPGFVLWNTIIGEGWAEQASNSTLVVVEVAGLAGSSGPDREVKVTVKEGGSDKLSKTTRLGVLDQDGKYHVPFWLYDTGCGQIRIRAELLGQTRDVMEKRIPFRCGE